MSWASVLQHFKPIPCESPRWVRNGHFQTLVGHFTRSPSAPPDPKIERLSLEDGDTLALHYYKGTSNIMLYLFHGLGGTNQADYIRRLSHLALSRGYHVVTVNHRGCGDGESLAREPYHSGRADDLSAVIAHYRRRFPDFKHVGIGYSLSGNAMLLLAAGVRGTTAPDLAVAVNAPIRLEKSAVALKQGVSRLYDLRFVQRCRASVMSRYRSGHIPLYKIPRFTTLHDFDNYYTAPAAGFRDREDYYNQCSASFFAHQIKTPTLVVTSKDDPFVDYRDYLETTFSSMVHLHLEEKGGHLGYLAKNLPAPYLRWIDYFLDQTISRVLESGHL